MSKFANCQQLKTVRSIALEKGLTVAYIYRLIEKGKLEGVKIDGVQFVVPDKPQA